jgi:hypothetical protein
VFGAPVMSSSARPLPPPGGRPRPPSPAFSLVGYLCSAVILVSLGSVIDAAGPLTGLTGFGALTISGAVVAVVLLRDPAGRESAGVAR